MHHIIKPTVGRKVWYRPTKNDLVGPIPMNGSIAPGAQPLDATIICVHGDRMVNVLVTDGMGRQFPVLSCDLLQPGDEPRRDPEGHIIGRYVEWMPHQTNAAAKVADEKTCI